MSQYMKAQTIKTFIALIKREILEHKNLWRVPLILLGIGVLLRLAMLVGNLHVDINIAEQFNQLDKAVDGIVNAALVKSLNVMNAVISISMTIVAIFYALSSLYDERQDQSVLFWRSLPISDSLTVASKLVIAIILVPVIILLAQAIVTVLFLGLESFSYLIAYYGKTIALMSKIILWSILPTIAWCLLCSAVANKNPFLLAFVAPIVFVLIDKLFLNGIVSETLVINRLTGIKTFATDTLLWGLLFSMVCIGLAIVKRSQRI